jgi:MOSC domain-containing protein YiiM
VSNVVQILVAAKRGAPMSAQQFAEALTEGGLRGDRYAEAKNRRSPDYQVTFIELENIEAFIHATGLALAADMPRRNIITRGIRLNGLCGKRFRVGRARFEGLELCEPCNLFAKRTHREVMQFFVGKGGLRARIVLGGEICVGDAIEVDA